MAVSDLTAARVRELLHYDPETGMFFWAAKSSRKARNVVGEEAGHIDHQGYRLIYIDRRRYRAHWLAWMYVYGVLPTLIDHRNGIRSDNRIANLREASVALNSRNRHAPHAANPVGILGVVISKRGTYSARIRATLGPETVQLYLGSYDTKERAQQVYQAAKLLLHPEVTA